MLSARDYVSRHGYLFAVALLTVLGFVLRLRYLHQPMRYDEAYSYLFFVNVPLVSTLSDYSLPNQHILNSLLMRVSVAAFGNAPWALRLPAFLFGVCTIPAIYFGLRRLLGPPAALLAAAFAAVSAQLILYSTNARGYSLIVLLFVGTIGVSAALREAGRTREWIWLVVFSVLGLYTIPIMLYAIGGVFIWHAAQAWTTYRRHGHAEPLRRVARAAAATAVLTFILYTPVLIGTGLGPLIANDWVTSRTPSGFLAELPGMLHAVWLAWHAAMPLPMVVLLVVGVASYVLIPNARAASASLLAAILLWCLALLLATMRPPLPRVWLFLLPLYFGVAAAGLVSLIRAARVRSAPLAVLFIALFMSAYGAAAILRSAAVETMEGPRFPDAQAVVDFLAAEARPGDGVYVRTPADAPLWYYTWRRGLSDAMLRLNYNADERVLVIVNEAAGQSIDGLRAVTPLALEQYSEPRLVRRFPAARVYEVERRRFRQ